MFKLRSELTVKKENPHVKRMKESIEQIAGFDIDQLGTGKHLGDMTFSDATPLFQKIANLLSSFDPALLQELPLEERELSAWGDSFSSIARTFKQIEDFKLGGNAEQNRKSLIDRCQNAYRDIWNSTSSYWAFFVAQSGGMTEVQERSRLFEAELTRHRDDAIAKIERAVADAETAAAQIAVERNAVHFQELAELHERGGIIWLVVTLLFNACAIAAVVTFLLKGPYWPQTPDELPPATGFLAFLLPKLFLISIFFFLAAWSAKNYRAHRHLAVTSKHREVAIKTFQLFASEAHEDPAVKNAVLLETTRSIFAPISSGYLSADPKAPTERMFEVVQAYGTAK